MARTVRRPTLDELWSTTQEQQARIARLEAELKQQRTEGKERGPEDAGNGPQGRVSRAGLLKAAAAGAAGLVAGGALRDPEEALAATGDNLVLGKGNDAGSETYINADANFAGPAVFRADAYNSGVNGATNIDGIQGQGNGAYSGVAGWGEAATGAA